MTSLRGTRALLRLALRRDRIQLPIWIVSLAGLLAAQVAGLVGIYDTPHARAAYARVNAGSAGARMFGSIDGPTLGAITMVEIYGFLAIMFAVMSTFAVVRHTRRGEERGQLELVRSGVVGVHASMAAALLTTIIANVAVAAACWVALLRFDLDPAGTALMCSSLAACGITFGALAALVAQLSPSARVANSLTGLGIGLAFLARAIGDVIGPTEPSGMAVDIAWPSWLSPLGWGQLAYPFSDQHWWALAPAAGASVCFVAVALVIEARRDFGQGVLTPHRRPARGAGYLRSSVGLALRLQRGVLIAWSIVALSVGAIVGGFAGVVDDMLGGNDAAAEVFAALGGSDALLDNYFAIMGAYIGLTVAGFAMQAMQRLHSEESSGTLESILATRATRTRFLLGHLVVVVAGSVLLMAFAAGTGAWSTVLAGHADRARDVLVGMAVQLPAVAVLVGTAVLGFGVSARWSTRVGWGAFAFCVVVFVGSALQLPDRVLELSPFSHVPLVPTEHVRATPLLVLGALALVLVLAGLGAFQRRDVRTR
jgi:ABC-2 type transport system permease protein